VFLTARFARTELVLTTLTAGMSGLRATRAGVAATVVFAAAVRFLGLEIAGLGGVACLGGGSVFLISAIFADCAAQAASAACISSIAVATRLDLS
jgi:hypothetical protein